jgi:hypothetical protein
MNEVSIIINGVRYDSRVADINGECDSCDLKKVCDGCSGESFNRACLDLIGIGYNFKRSTKSFEP